VTHGSPRGWLGLAIRAMEFKATQQKQLVNDKRTEARAADRTLEAHRRDVESVGVAWRRHLGSAYLDPGLLELFRAHGTRGAVLMLEHERALRDAAAAVADEEVALRQLVHGTRALEAMAARRQTEQRLAADRATAREGNELWAARSGGKRLDDAH